MVLNTIRHPALLCAAVTCCGLLPSWSPFIRNDKKKNGGPRDRSREIGSLTHDFEGGSGDDYDYAPSDCHDRNNSATLINKGLAYNDSTSISGGGAIKGTDGGVSGAGMGGANGNGNGGFELTGTKHDGFVVNNSAVGGGGLEAFSVSQRTGAPAAVKQSEAPLGTSRYGLVDGRARTASGGLGSSDEDRGRLVASSVGLSMNGGGAAVLYCIVPYHVGRVLTLTESRQDLRC